MQDTFQTSKIKATLQLMKHTFITFLLLFIINPVFSQSVVGRYVYQQNSPYRDYSLTLDSSGYFRYAENYFFCCTGGCPPLPIAIGRWEETEDAIILKKLPEFYASPIKEVKFEQSFTKQDQLLVTLQDVNGQALRNFRVRLYYTDSNNDFKFHTTDENGQIEVNRKAYNLLTLHTRQVVQVPLNFETGGQLTVQLWESGRYQVLKLPKHFVLTKRKDGGLQYQSATENYSYHKCK